MTAPITIALAVDRSYVPWAGVVIRSLLDYHAPGDLRVVVLRDSNARPEPIGDRDARRLVSMAPDVVEIVPVGDPRLARLPATERFGSVVWLPFLLPELLPECGRVIALDADVLIASPLHPLHQHELDGAAVGAVQNVLEPAMRGHARSVVGDGAYFNTGMLLLDLDVLRSEDATAALLARAERDGSGSRWPDQDVLNAHFAGRWHELHPRWNAQASLWSWPEWADETFGADRRRAAVDDPAIVHFEGPTIAKPWHPLCPHPWRDSYLDTLATTPWAGEEKRHRSLTTRALGLLPPRARIPAYVRLANRRGEELT